MVTTTDSGRPLDERLNLLLSSDPGAMSDPFPVWNELRETDPVHRHGATLLVSDYATVKGLSRDERGLSNRYSIEGSLFEANRARLGEEERRAQQEVADFEALYLSRSDGASHDRLRKIAHRAFTPRRIAEMEASLERYTSELLDALPREEPIDFRERFAYRLPMLAISDMLGVPHEQQEEIRFWSNRLARNRGGDDPQAVLAARDAMLKFRNYVENILVPLREVEPSTDLLTDLLGAEGEERMIAKEMTATFVILLFAGHETTTNLISIGLQELLEHPDQWDRLRQEPDLVGNAVEELLRWVSPVQWNLRVAATDQVIGGHEVKVGDSISLVVSAANRDPAQFDRPDELDLGRENSRSHLALGFGPHFCLGNALARLEAKITLAALVERFPDVRPAGEPAGWTGNALLRSLTDLPLVLGPEAS